MDATGLSSPPEAAPAPAREPREPFPWGPAASVMAALAATAMSATITVAELLLGQERSSFVFYNNVPIGARRAMLAAVGAAMVVTLVTCLVKIWRRRSEAVASLRVAAAVASPLLVAWAVPPLFTPALPAEKPLGYLSLLALLALALERLLAISFAAMPPGWAALGARISRRTPAALRRVAPAAIVATAAAAYVVYTSYYTVIQHRKFQTSGYDLGIYTSLIRDLQAGYFYRSPILNPDVSYLSHHAEFGAAYLVPFYAIHPRAETLLAIQSLTLGAAAIPLYAFAATQLPRSLAVLFALAYLFFAPMHGANFYDFHWMPMTLPLWFTLLYGIAKRRLSVIIPMVALVLPMREETGLMLGAVGLLLLTSGYWPKLGLIFGALGVGWFLTMRFVVIPSYGDAGFAGIYAALVPFGDRGFGAVIRTLVSNPNYVWTTLATESKLKFVLHMLGPLALLPVRRPALLVLLIPGALFTLLTTDYEPTVSIAFQYTTHWIPWLFAGAILTVRHFATEGAAIARQRGAAIAVFVAVLCHSYAYGGILRHEGSLFQGGFRRVTFDFPDGDRARYADFRKIVEKVPRTASVAATDPQSPHFGEWVTICSLRITHCDAEYLFISRKQFAGEDRRNVQTALAHAPYGLAENVGDFYLFKRGLESPRTKAALRELGLPAN